MATEVAGLLDGSREYIDLTVALSAAFLLTRRVSAQTCTYYYELWRFDAGGAHSHVELGHEPACSVVTGDAGRRVVVAYARSLTLLDGETLRPLSNWQAEGTLGRVLLTEDETAVLFREELPTIRGEPAEGRVLRLDLLGQTATPLTTPPVADFAVSSEGRLAVITPPKYVGGQTNELWISSGDAWQRIELGLHLHVQPRFSPDGRRLALLGSSRLLPTVDFPLLQVSIVELSNGRPTTLSPLAITHGRGRADPGPRWLDSEVLFRHADKGRIGLCRGQTVVVDGERQVLGFGATASSLVWAEASHEHSLSLCWAEHGGGVSRRWAPNVELDLWVAGIPRQRRQFRTKAGATVEAELLGGRASLQSPLLVSLHGGPHGFVGPGLAPTHFYRWLLAKRGWLVVAPDLSGSGTYSDEHTLSIRSRWGELDLAEVHDVVDALIAEGRASPDSLAVAGFSYGGYLAAQLVTRSERFRSATVGGSLLDLRDWFRESDIGDTYLDWHFRGDQPGLLARLEAASVRCPVDRGVSAAILALGGLDDARCPPGAAVRFIDELKARGAIAEWIGYAGEGHGLPGSGGLAVRCDYHRRVVSWHEAHGGVPR